MSLTRLLVAGAVTGMVACGGAVTGTTLAAWRDQAAVAAHIVNSGDLRITATAADPVTNLELGQAGTTRLTVTNAAPPGARNLRATLHLDGIAISGPAASHLEVAAVDIASGSDCTGPQKSPAWQRPADGWTPVQLGGTTGPQQQVTVCLAVRLAADAPADAQGQTNNLTLSLRAQQVRP